jgi:hypothetical protein
LCGSVLIDGESHGGVARAAAGEGCGGGGGGAELPVYASAAVHIHTSPLSLLTSSLLPSTNLPFRCTILALQQQQIHQRPIQRIQEPRRALMSTHASVLVDSVGPPSAEVCRAAASFP